MVKKSLIGFGSVALALALVACDDEKKPEAKAPVAQPSAPAAPAEPAEPANPVFKAKVRKVIGETELQRKNAESWKQLRQGQSVFEMDRIRTAKESETLLGVNDGSVITVSENSDVTINAEIINELNRKVAITINNGKVYFDVQKQQDGNSLEFRTGTATAAIRGTAGFVGSVDGQTVASLKEGKLAVTSETNETAEIVENQTVLVNKKGKTRSLKLKSSGTKALAAVLDSIVTESAKNPEAPVDENSLTNALESFDVGYAQKQAAFEKSVVFMVSPLPDTIYTPSVTLKAKATPGIVVTILGEKQTVGADSSYTQTFEWGASEFGKKRFLVSLSNGEVDISLGMMTTIYADKSAEVPAVDTIPAEPAKIDTPAVAPKDSKKSKKDKAKVEPKKEEPKVEPKKEEPKKKPVSVSVSVGSALEKIHNAFGTNPRANGYKGKVYKTNLKIKLNGVSSEELGEIASVRVLRNGDEEKTFSPVTSTSLSVPVSVDVNTIAEYEVIATMKDGKTSKAKKRYEVFCNARVHNPMDLTQYISPDMNEAKEYEGMASKLKRD